MKIVDKRETQTTTTTTTTKQRQKRAKGNRSYSETEYMLSPLHLKSNSFNMDVLALPSSLTFSSFLFHVYPINFAY